MTTPLLRPRLDDPRLKRDRRFPLRRLTAPLRALPDFLIVGAMKSGTSSLYTYLCQHPSVRPPVRKELHYFTVGHRSGKTDAWYSANFPLRARLRGGAVTGEATPGYMFEPEAVRRMAALVPEAKLIVLLRDPVERAISQYFHERRMGREYLPIDEAMAAEEERLAEAQRQGVDGLETWLHASYKRRGLYADQIETLYDAYPREQVLILGSRTLFATPAAALDEVLTFLGLQTAPTGVRFEAKNESDNRTSVPESLRDELAEFFAPHNARLFDLIGRRLDW